nr:hypothetical protein [Tanacetum cinerariifolium]
MLDILPLQDQDRATIDKSSTLPYDSAPRVTSHAAVEGSMQQTIPELMTQCTSLQRKLSDLTDKFQAQEVEINRLKEIVKQLEEKEGVAATNSRDDALIKGRGMDEREVAKERVSDDTEEMATVLTSMDATTVLASGVVDVPTGSGSIPTASTLAEGSIPTGSDEVPTTSPVFATATLVTPVTRRKELKRKSWTKKQKRDYYMAVIRNNLGWKLKDFRGMTFEEVEAKFNSVCKQMEDFIHMGSKEEAKRIKRKDLLKYLDREDINQLWRLVKETLSNRPPSSDKEIELWVELNRMYEPDKEDQLWTHTQNFMHAPVDWKLYDSCGVHHVASKDKQICMLVEKDYPLRKDCKLSKTARNKMHKAFPLPVIKFPLAQEVPTASVKGCHCQKKSEATAMKIALLC